MKKIYLLITVFLVIFSITSCGSKNSGNTINNSRASGLVKRLDAKIDVFENYNLYSTKYFSAKVPKNWKTYVEPRIKEQIRLSPTNLKSKIMRDQYIWISAFESKNPKRDVENWISRAKQNKDYYDGFKIVDVKVQEASDMRGKFTKITKTLKSNKKSSLLKTYYYTFKKKLLHITEILDVNSKHRKDFESIINSIEIK